MPHRTKTQEEAQRRYNQVRSQPYNPNIRSTFAGVAAGYGVDSQGNVSRIPEAAALPAGWSYNERGQPVPPPPPYSYEAHVNPQQYQLIVRNAQEVALRNQSFAEGLMPGRGNKRRRRENNVQMSFTFGSVVDQPTMQKLQKTIIHAFNNAQTAPIENKNQIIEAQAQMILNDFRNNNAIFPLEFPQLVNLLDGLNASYHLASLMGRQENVLAQTNEKLIKCLTGGDLGKLPLLITDISLYNGQLAQSSLEMMQQMSGIIQQLQNGGQQLMTVTNEKVQELNKALEQLYYFQAVSEEYKKLIEQYSEEKTQLQIQHDNDVAKLDKMTRQLGETTEEFERRESAMKLSLDLKADSYKKLEEDRAQALILYNNATQETSALAQVVQKLSQTLGINSMVNNSLVDISNAVINETQKTKDRAESLMKQQDENTKKIEEQSQQIAAYEEGLQAARENNRKQAQTLKEKSIEIIELKEELEKTQKQVERKEEVKGKMRKALFEAGTQVRELKQQLQQSEERYNKMDELGVNALMESEAEKRRLVNEYEEKVANLEQENLELNREIDELRGVRGRLIATNQQLEAQVEAAHGEIEQVVADNAENVQQLARVNATLALERQNALLRTNDGINENFSQLNRLSREIDQGLAELQRTMENQMPESAGVFQLPPDPVPPINLDTQTVLLSQAIEVGRLVGATVPQIVPRLDPPPVYRRGGETKVAERKVRRRPVLPKTDSKAKATPNNAKWIGKPIKQGGYVVGGRPDPYIHKGGAAFWKNLYKSNYHFL